MGPSEWLQLAGAALSGSALPWLAGSARRWLFKDEKAAAEARKLNVEADDYITQRLYAEIERLDKAMFEVRTEFRDELAGVKSAAQDEKVALVEENKQLRTEVGKLRRRVEGLEKILKLKPLTEEDRAMLAELDRVTAHRSER